MTRCLFASLQPLTVHVDPQKQLGSRGRISSNRIGGEDGCTNWRTRDVSKCGVGATQHILAYPKRCSCTVYRLVFIQALRFWKETQLFGRVHGPSANCVDPLFSTFRLPFRLACLLIYPRWPRDSDPSFQPEACLALNISLSLRDC